MMNTIIFAATISWLIAQLVKILFGFIRYGMNDRSRTVWRVLWAGGMPSIHSAVMASSTLSVFLSSGSQSALFGIMLLMACIVIYDRCRMYSIYNTFQKRYPILKDSVENDPILKDLVGHRIPEILLGIIVGLVSGYMVYILIP